MALYLMCSYINPELDKWIREQFKARGKKIDMGKSCIRFKKLEDLPLDVIGEAFAKVTTAGYVKNYEALLKK